MSGSSGESASGLPDPRAAGLRGSGQVSFLDQALWKQFNEAKTPEAFLRSWLALQCRLIAGTARGLVVLAEGDQGKFAPAAFWPDEDSVGQDFSSAIEAALSERRGIIQDGQSEPAAQGEAADCRLAYPFVVDGRLYGAVAIETTARPARQLRGVMRQLQWGASWIEVLWRRERAQDERDRLARTTAALDLVGIALDEDRFQAACNALVTELATRLDCDQVSIGVRRRGRITVRALSHAAQFGQKMNLIRDIGAAMDEAVDQESIILYPPDAQGDFYISRAHGELARAHDAGSILTVPLGLPGRHFGAITYERPPGDGFDQATIDLCDCVGAVLGPLLDAKRRDDRHLALKIGESAWTQLARLFGPRHLGRKLALAATLLAVAVLAVAEGDYRVTSPARIEGLVQRVVVAPFDGYVATESARAGETVGQGQVLATLDDKDLALERLRWTTTRRQRSTEYNRALAARERADVNIIKAQIDQAEAQIALLDEQIARTKLMAPFNGIVVSGDLSQSIGGAVQRGEELFEIAPLQSYRVILEVDETDVAEMVVGQAGTLIVSSLPGDQLQFTVDRITPVSESAEGRTYFRVEARLQDVNPRLRPGMEGIAKTNVDRRRLGWIWSHKLIDWVRLKVWAWLP